jgi:hypothetical protein
MGIILTAAMELDFEAVAASVDLPGVLRSEGIDVGRSGKAFCPFHANSRTPAMTVYEKGGKWRYKCHSCGAKGDGIDWRAERDGISKVEAAKRIAGIDAFPRPKVRITKPEVAKAKPSAPVEVGAPPHRHPEWQEAADALIVRAQETLWGPEGVKALEWLRARGLEDRTLIRFRVGFLTGWTKSRPLACLADRQGTPQPIQAPGGAVFPWVRPGGWFDPGSDPGFRWIGANVRRLNPDPFQPWESDADKYFAFAGSVRGHLYPLDAPGEGVPFLLLEGEPDALLGWQEGGPFVNAGSIGGSTQAPKSEAIADLEKCPAWLLCQDFDDAGGGAAERLRQLDPGRARRVYLPSGKDLTEFVQGSGDVSGWLRSELDRLGRLERPLSRSERKEQRLGVAPHEVWKLWRRRADALPPEGATAEQIEEAGETAYRELARGEAVEVPEAPERPPAVRLAMFLAGLRSDGLLVKGKIIFPTLTLTTTQRITYSDPPAQTWNAEERREWITPNAPGRRFLIADYGQIEPRILIEVLRRRGLMDWRPDVGDVYRELLGEGARSEIKVAINRFINGGKVPPAITPRFGEFLRATEVLRESLVGQAKADGFVESLAGRRMLLDPAEKNFRGRVLNRLIQGSASDAFNAAACGIEEELKASRLPADVRFLVYDELWCEAHPEAAPVVEEVMRRQMAASAEALGLMIPVKFEGQSA